MKTNVIASDNQTAVPMRQTSVAPPMVSAFRKPGFAMELMTALTFAMNSIATPAAIVLRKSISAVMVNASPMS